jgi:hypothetical protein
VHAARFAIVYDPALFTPLSAQLAAGLPAGTSLSVNFTTPGYARFTLSAPKLLPAGTIPLITLQATVPPTAPYAATQVLDIVDLFLNGSLPGAQDDAIQVVGLIGDTSADATYSTLDVQRLQRTIVRLDSGFSGWKNVDPILIGDVNGSGGLTSLDATRLMQEVSYLDGGDPALDRPELPPIPQTLAPLTFSGPDPVVSTARSTETGRVEPLTMPVTLANENVERAPLPPTVTPVAKSTSLLGRLEDTVAQALREAKEPLPADRTVAPALPIRLDTGDAVKTLRNESAAPAVALSGQPLAVMSDLPLDPAERQWKSAFVSTLGRAPTPGPNASLKVTLTPQAQASVKAVPQPVA